MAKDEAYRIAEKKIEEARRTGAEKLDLVPEDSDEPKLTELPKSLVHLSELQELNLAHNQLTALPESLGKLSQLKELNLSANQLTALPEWLGKLSQLKELNLSANQLAALPESLDKLSQLKELDISNNQLTALPESLGLLSQLQRLGIQGNQLTALPESLGLLTRLQGLGIQGNQLTALPESLSKLTQLQRLSLPDNQLTALPESLGKLSQLKELNLSANQLTALPESIKELCNLTELFLHDNPDLKLPVEILGPTWQETVRDKKPADPAAILDYYFKVRAGGRPLNEVRLVLVGRGGAGKTSLVDRLVWDKFDPHREETPGVALCDWQIKNCPGGEVLAHVWDFAGQTITHSMHQFFLSERTAYVLVLTGRENSEREDAEYWLRLIVAYGTDSEKNGPPVIVVLNKWDDRGAAHARIDRNALLERYPSIVGFVETDCATKTGIPELHKLICGTVDKLPWVRAHFPEEYRRVKDRLRAVSDPHLAYDDYRVICLECGVADETKQDLLAKNLHALGVALHFRDDKRLRLASMLKPEWLTDNVYALVRYAEEKRGILLRGELPTVLAKEGDEAIRLFLVEMMVRFELAFPLAEDDATSKGWLVPQALPDSQPAEVSEFRAVKDATRLQYRYRALPVSIVPRFIVRTHPFIEDKLRWKSGVVLVKEGARALVRADYAEKTVEVTVTGPAEARQELAGLAQRELRLINGEIKGLNPTEEMIAETSELVASRDPQEFLKRQKEGRELLTQGQYSESRRKFAQILQDFPQFAGPLRDELGFVFDFNEDESADSKRWEHERGIIDWRRKVWSILQGSDGFDSRLIGGKPGMTEKAKESQQQKSAESPQVAETPEAAKLKPEKKGEALEQATLALLKKLFSFDESTERRILDELHQQQRGSQLGYDIGATICTTTANGGKVRCRFECKAQETKITSDTIGGKLQEARAFQKNLDHWILIAPRADVANTLRTMIERWEDEQEFPFRVQLWTKDSGIGDFFGLEPALFDFWCSDHESPEHPSKWDEQRREEVLEYWRRRLEPPLKFGAAWKRYLTDRIHLRIYSDEAQDALDHLQESYVEMQGLDETGTPLPEPLHETVIHWLKTESRILLLLGDFGDGKTVFTYFLTVRLLEKFRLNPRDAWLPIRFSLRDFTRTGVYGARDFLRRRLEEFGAGIDDWVKLSSQHKILVILDGIDEMSKSISRVMISELVNRLVECCNVEFGGHRIILTCRSTFFDGLVDRLYLMDCLNTPLLIRLKSLDRASVLEKLASLATSAAQKSRLESIRLMHDPVGLATKPLFLKMISETVWDSNVDLADEVALYDEYAAKCLRRKYELLEHNEIRVPSATLIERMCQVLEDLALDIHVNVREYSLLKPPCIDEKKGLYAEVLWRATKSEESDDDATSRIGVRSLLRKVDLKGSEDEQWPVDFCHRSMREYFVARKLKAVIRDSPNRAREILAGSDLSREIMRFLTCLMKRGSGTGEYHAGLRALALQSKGDSRASDLTLEQKAKLGRNAVMLLYLSEGHLEEDDWSGFLLDGIDLSQADLRRKCFANASLRNARLDSVDFRSADFRGADLTGVCFEETGVIRSLSVLQERDAFVASYADGTIRRWKLGGIGTAESSVCFRPAATSGQRCEVAAIPGTSLCVLCGETLIFADYRDSQHKAVSRFLLPNTVSIRFSGDSVLIVKKETNDSFLIARYLLDGEQAVLVNTKKVGSHRLCDALGGNGLVVAGPGDSCTILRYGDDSYETKLEVENACSALATIAVRTGNKEEFIIACAEQLGFVNLFRCRFSADNQVTIEKRFRLKIHDGVVGALAFVSGQTLLTGGADKRICRIEIGEEKAAIADTYQLVLRCSGMKIDGIKGVTEYQTLNSLIQRA